MPPVATIHQSRVQTETKERPQSRVKGTGPYGATLERGVLSRPLDDVQILLPKISITQSDIEIKGHVEDSVIGRCVQNDGMIEFEIESKDESSIELIDGVKMVNGRGAALDAAPGAAVAQSVLGSPFIGTVLATTARAGNVCLAGEYEVSKFDIYHNIYLFAAGHVCEDSNSLEYGDEDAAETACDILPLPVQLCGQNANLVATDQGLDNIIGCRIGLEIGGTVYSFNPDDGNAHTGPCDAECGTSTGIDGFLQFVGVPICDLRWGEMDVMLALISSGFPED
ncbi:hypothetical protein F5Y08DRAFT_336384 [Xylaria arbuscula]|nr:hypothetical protein F5Y08DRAFT_336384 [Xylaria arbuscula]